jgi:hypothetical protein
MVISTRKPTELSSARTRGSLVPFMVCCRARGYERKQQAGCPAPGEEAGGNHSTAFSGCNQASGALFGLTGFSNALVDRSSARFLPNGNSRSCPSRRFLPFQPMRLLAEREHAHFNPPADQRQEIGPGPVRPRMRTRRPDQYPGGRHRVPRPHLRWAVAVGVVPSTRVRPSPTARSRTGAGTRG